MEKSVNFLFGGTNFNRKKFAPDFAKIARRRMRCSQQETELLEEEEEEPEQEKAVSSSSKKRKRKSANSEPVERIRCVQELKEVTEMLVSRKQYNIHVSGNNIPAPLKSFTELSSRYGCKKYILRNLAGLDFREPTPIQRQAIPVLLSGRECFACAPTGAIPTDGIRAVILSPARELAAQTAREGKKLIKGSKFNIRLMTKPSPKLLISRSCSVMFSYQHPWRLKRAIKAKKIDLSKVEYLVLDESDKLFEQSMLKANRRRGQGFATLPDSVEELARSIMHDAVRVIIGRKNTASKTVKQKLVSLELKKGSFSLFAKALHRVGVIHSDLPAGERENAVDSFRAGETWVLIATDVIARGMDFKGINCVINYDFPDSASAYIHRIGRSGRAGRSGEAITFYTEEDMPFLRNIANTMTSSGCEVPSWIMTLKKKKWKKHRPKRDAISTRPKESKIEQEE
ncbi:DEAD-box ATP-dependent RNA helicase 57 [Raphanus sativus]|nr:DEAD-box ATP-dependent RNA helicase 57 [Raphanus sativus]